MMRHRNIEHVLGRVRWSALSVFAAASLLVSSAASQEAHRAGGLARVRDPDLAPLTNADLMAGLERAHDDVRACLIEAGARDGTIRVRISAAAELRVTARSRPRGDAVETCMDTAVRRHVTPMLGRVETAVSARLTVTAAVSIARPPRGTFSAELRDALGGVDPALRACLAAHGTGSFTVRGVANDAGQVTVEQAWSSRGDTVTLVPEAVLTCLRTAVAGLALAPGSRRIVDRDVAIE